MTTLLDVLARIAAQQAEHVRDGGSVCGAPEVDIVFTHEAGGRRRVWFVFDVLVCHGVLSGSDNYAHHVLAAKAVLAGDASGRLTVERLMVEPRAVEHPTEWQVEWAPDDQRHDRDAVRRAASAAWRRELGLDP